MNLDLRGQAAASLTHAGAIGHDVDHPVSAGSGDQRCTRL